ncbi:hypothetical protein CK503_10815 [Aliifodinibius salipaludis]|uniref:IPT/TIG domain-containing protein n=1 Tax=Fodinibius salipaludis TaxID=2032627 RepID=A0A2A2G8K2_9BACT|nr:IPT/TIG domain-containing protein [Aliifodinibius salipaludis]PAU93638.1 hypothetical protein CK503_10815 [Aliifodinibius salipaludis]
MRRFLLMTICVAIVFAFGSCGTDSGGPNPQIDGLQPDSGPPGTMVTVNGSGFSPEAASNTVTFDGTTAPVNSATESTIETEVPDGLSQGSVPVEVTVGDQTASGPSFTVEQAAPGISSVEPDSGTVGTEVTINGMNFSATASENTIAFNGTQAPVNGAAEDQLLTEVPQGATDGPIEVTVKQKSTTGPDFDVITEGTLKLITSTSGKNQDSNGYTGTVDGSASKLFKANDDKFFVDLQKGSHDVELSGIAQNCTVSGNNPRSVSITAGDTTSTTFDVSCQAVATDKIVFDSDRASGSSRNFDIYIMSSDGSSPFRLTTDPAYEFDPDVSPDGTKILFSSERDGNREIYTMDADGSNLTRITNNSTGDVAPTWSPDGSEIAFISNRDESTGELYTMNADGSSVQRLTNNSAYNDSPDWSPDGSKIAFRSNRDGDYDIYKINPDGSGLQQLTINSVRDSEPAWSPDGEHIIFQSELPSNRDLYKMSKAGNNLINLTDDPALDGGPSWGPQN